MITYSNFIIVKPGLCMFVYMYVFFFFNRHVIRGMELQDKEAQKD